METNMTLLGFSDLQSKGIKFTRQHIHRLIKRAIFPRPIKPGLRENAWLEDEIDQYLETRKAARLIEKQPA
jgi:prophage regulatory protein